MESPYPTRLAGPGMAGRSVSFHLARFAVALVLPILVGLGLMLWQRAEAERAALQESATEAAQSAALAVDRELVGLSAALEVMLVSRELREGNLAGFHRQASAVRDRLGLQVVLRERDGTQLVNTRLPWGTDLPRAALPDPGPALWEGGRPVVSDLFLGAVTGTAMFAVQGGVRLPDGRQAILGLSLPVERIRQLLVEEGVPEGWTLAVVDGAGRILARNIRHEELVGREATADLRANTQGQGGTWRGTTLDGTKALGAYAVTRLAGWRVAVGVPEQQLTAPLHDSLRLLAGVGFALLLISALLAFLFARAIALPLQALARQAAALGRGERLRLTQTRVREIGEISLAMVEASRRLRAREAELQTLNAGLERHVEERTEELSEANARLRAEAAERERAEAQFRQAQKMEAVGRLTGGVAHDFNNLLTVVIGNLSLIRRQIGPEAPERLQRAVHGADEGARRAAELTRRLLAFSRQQALAPEPVEVNRLVAGMSDLLQRTIGEEVQVETVLAGGLWRALVDPNQLESALLNLAVNARDAMPEGGKLTIETANAHLDEAYAAARAEVRPGQYVMVSVSDTGTGMTPEVLARAFEPFFTTKPVGKGTGLGLSQVYGFAKQTGGHAAIYSELGQGTVVKLYLPRMRESGPVPIAPTPGIQDPLPLAPGRGETVLLVEDEPMVRDFAATALEDAGYRVLLADQGPAAIALLETHPEIALVFTDVVLTGPMNGRALADVVAARWPKLPVLFSTGYTRNAIIHHGRLDPGVELLNKPYTGNALAAKVRQMLDARKG
ncbi:ATP-binding protein [Siccirubricoccus phaeus]|uniref:ATP-binding protein n=1 Tax=Siccirubricoccus phaeus TaxID=2595053 RepID=UPI001A9C4DA5|nr:ATP-binding protein [Siccirubricoccus phaeus]